MDFITPTRRNANDRMRSHYGHNYRFYCRAQLSHERTGHPETVQRANIKTDGLINPVRLL